VSFQSATGLGHRPTDEALVRQTKSWSASADAVVFVIESDDPARNAIKQLLESVGLHVEPFRSAVEFLDGVVPEKPCCVVLALRMPMMTGLRLQEELTKTGIHVPLIFVTGYGSIATAVRAMKAGAVDFLTKPINEQDLLDAVFVALERDRLRHAQEHALAGTLKRFKTLTPRERDVLFRVAAGRLNKQIADELCVSEVMVKVHRSHAMRKMNAKSVPELVRMSYLLQSELSASGMHESAPRAAKAKTIPLS
jgi:FixJ family two-component response regulator